MLGTIPESLKVNGKSYTIRTDFRVVLRTMSIFSEKSLSDTEKVYLCLKRTYKTMSDIPADDYAEAYKAALSFIEGPLKSGGSQPRTVNWEKDEPIIFSEINRIAGCEVRQMEYLHWWTFLGYFHSISRDSLFGAVLAVRSKQVKGKKLEEYEKEFLRENRELCALEPTENNTPEDTLKSYFDELAKEAK